MLMTRKKIMNKSVRNKKKYYKRGLRFCANRVVRFLDSLDELQGNHVSKSKIKILGKRIYIERHIAPQVKEINLTFKVCEE